MLGAVERDDEISDAFKSRVFREAISWKMNNKRVLDEIVAREMMQREVLTEKVRREIQFHREMAGGGFRNGMLFFNGESHSNRRICLDYVRNFTASVSEERVQPLHLLTLENEKRPESSFSDTDDQLSNQVQSNLITSEFKRKMEDTPPAICTGPRPTDIPNLPEPQNHEKSARRMLNENAGNKKSRPSKKAKLIHPPQNWSCSICKVSTSSEMNLQSHLQGKMHNFNLRFQKANQLIKNIGSRTELISRNTDAENSSSFTTASPDSSVGVSIKPLKINKHDNGEERPPHSEPKASVDDGETLVISANTKRIKMQVDGALHEVIQAGGYFWCELCRLKFNDAVMIANHLCGTIHMSALSESENRSQIIAKDGICGQNGD